MEKSTLPVFSFSGLSTYQECQRKYFYSYVRKIDTPKRQLPLEFGSAWHEALTEWYNTRTVDKAIAKFNSLYKDDQEDSLRTQATAAKMLRGYAAKYASDKFEIIESEKPMAVNMGQAIYVVVIDRLFNWNGLPTIQEVKTTSRLSAHFFKQFKTNMQIDGEIFATISQVDKRCMNVMIDAAWVGKTKPTGGDPFVRDITSRTPTEMAEFKATFNALVKEILSKKEFSEFIPNFGACTNWGECKYRALCSAPPEVRDRLIRAEYVPKDESYRDNLQAVIESAQPKETQDAPTH